MSVNLGIVGLEQVVNVEFKDVEIKPTGVFRNPTSSRMLSRSAGVGNRPGLKFALKEPDTEDGNKEVGDKKASGEHYLPPFNFTAHDRQMPCETLGASSAPFRCFLHQAQMVFI